MFVSMTSELLLAVALGFGLGMGLMAVVREVLHWDGQRRMAGQIAAAAEERRAALQQVQQRQADEQQRQRRIGGLYSHRRPPAGPDTDPDPRPRLRADDTAAGPAVPVWDGNGQKNLQPRAPWEDPRTGDLMAVPPYTRPYTDRQAAPAAGTY